MLKILKTEAGENKSLLLQWSSGSTVIICSNASANISHFPLFVKKDRSQKMWN